MRANKIDITRGRIVQLFNYAGKRRFDNIMSIYVDHPELRININKMIYLYDKKIHDPYERMKFSDRLSNKGFYRYSPDNVHKYFRDFIEVMTEAENLKLI